MTHFVVQRSSLSGQLTTPPSKSHSIRALFFAALADGISHIDGVLASPDIDAAIAAFRLFGAHFDAVGEHDWLVRGVAGHPSTPTDVVNAGNSGLVFRFATALGALTPGYTVVTGDASVRTQRPILPLLDALQQLDATAISSQGNGQAPVIVKGPMRAGHASLHGADSQPVSALLMTVPFLQGTTTLHVEAPGELPWIALTLDWLSRLGISCSHKDYQEYRIDGPIIPKAFHYRVPGDFSSALYPIVAGILTDSEVTVENLDLSDVQGDKRVLDVLRHMGARLHINPERGQVSVLPGSTLKGIAIDMNPIIDALPLLAVVGCFAAGETHVYNASIARCKESDRISAIASELTTLGAEVIEHADGLTIRSSKLSHGAVSSHHDHRIAMSLAVAGMASNGPVTVQDVSCIAKTFPCFTEHMCRIGAKIEHPGDLS